MKKPDRKSQSIAYPGGFPALVAQMDARRAPLQYAANEGLPPLECDLDAMRRKINDGTADSVADSTSTYAAKLRSINKELAGKSELCCLNALLIAHLRKVSQPSYTAQLFHRLWREHGDHLLSSLDARWLVSSMTTFGDHGLSEVQRRVGQSLGTLFAMMKLYETERLFSGTTPERAFAWENRVKRPLALEMDAYAIPSGGLDVNLLARLWQDAQDDAVLAPLANHLLNLLISDERTVFRRLAVMKKRRLRAKRSKLRKGKTDEGPETAPDPRFGPVIVAPSRLSTHSTRDPRWGIVSTVRAPLKDIARFAAHHLEAGAESIDLYLDDPSPEQAEFLRREPRIRVIACDSEWWGRQKRPRMATHQLRQLHNATQSYAASDLDWIAHIDVDEFIICDKPLSNILKDADARLAALRLTPAEALAPLSGAPVRNFKLSCQAVGHTSAVLQDIYPDFGMHLRGGFLSHTVGKVVARCGLNAVRLGVHTLRHEGLAVDNQAPLPDAWLAHLHAPDWDRFHDHLEFRMQRGSYRGQTETEFPLSDLIQYLQDHEGEAALRHFFREVCEDRPELRARLAAHDMLLQHEMDLDAKVAGIFGRLPDDAE